MIAGVSRSIAGVAGALAAVAACGAVAALVAVAAPDERRGERSRARPAVRLNELARFDQPIFVGAPRGAGGLAFVVEREGRIKLLRGGEKVSGAFLKIERLVQCCEVEKGLLSVAFAPDYERSRRFYVYFTNRQSNIEIDEFKRARNNPRRADPDSRRKLVEIRQDGEINHNGGQVAFGPDGLLYAATGDGGNFEDPGEASQQKDSLLGKLLRINPVAGRRRDYRVPDSNPYVGEPGKDEIYARGLRNPFRFSFDRDRLLIADVGHSRREEVNAERTARARGANFGWPVYEGTLRLESGEVANHTRPIHQYSHSGGACTVIGGYVIRDPRLRQLRGRYLYGDYCSGELRSFIPDLDGSRRDRSLGVERVQGLVSFGVDGRKRVYVIAMSSGVVSRLDPR